MGQKLYRLVKGNAECVINLTAQYEATMILSDFLHPEFIRDIQSG